MACEIHRCYLKTIPFYLKIAELVCSIIIWICVAAVRDFPQYGGGGFINFCSTITFVFTLFLFFFYLFDKIKNLPGPWILIEVISIFSSAILFLISLIIAAASHGWGAGVIAAAVFCGIAMVIYLVELFFRFRVMRVEGFRFSAHLRSEHSGGTSQAPPDPQNPASGPYIIGA